MKEAVFGVNNFLQKSVSTRNHYAFFCTLCRSKGVRRGFEGGFEGGSVFQLISV
jgi:hypothetical protein